MVNIKLSGRASKLTHKVIIVDTSVLVKNFVEEQDSDLVDELIKLHQSKRMTLLSTPLLQFEFLNVITNIFKNEERVEIALKKFLQLEIGLIPSKYGYMEKGIKAACGQRNVSYYDSSYHALAKDMDGIFLTADKKYYDVMKDQGNILLLSNV